MNPETPKLGKLVHCAERPGAVGTLPLDYDNQTKVTQLEATYHVPGIVSFTISLVFRSRFDRSNLRMLHVWLFKCKTHT